MVSTRFGTWFQASRHFLLCLIWAAALVLPADQLALRSRFKAPSRRLRSSSCVGLAARRAAAVLYFPGRPIRHTLEFCDRGAQVIAFSFGGFGFAARAHCTANPNPPKLMDPLLLKPTTLAILDRVAIAPPPSLPSPTRHYTHMPTIIFSI